MLSMHLQCVVCLRNKRNNGCWTRGLLDNQKLLDQITVLVYHLMGSLVLTYKDRCLIGIGLEHFCWSVIKRSGPDMSFTLFEKLNFWTINEDFEQCVRVVLTHFDRTLHYSREIKVVNY